MQKFINLTPHTVNLVEGLGCPRVTRVWDPSGVVARVASVDQSTGKFFSGVALRTASFGEVKDLPEPREGVKFIVSGMVRSALPERKDLVSPGGLVRDSDGRVIGCSYFLTN